MEVKFIPFFTASLFRDVAVINQNFCILVHALPVKGDSDAGTGL